MREVENVLQAFGWLMWVSVRSCRRGGSGKRREGESTGQHCGLGVRDQRPERGESSLQQSAQMDKILYFAYGSNMSTPRLGERSPSAHTVAVARLQRHRLRFHKGGRDGSGKCDADFTDDEADVVFGVVFEIAAAEKLQLDEHEGLGKGYEEKRVSIYTEDGRVLEALTYYATSIDPELKPYDWYKEHVLRGAREHGLPWEHIESIAAVEAIPDPDSPRCERELAIYRDRPLESD